jgi:hypothetical protein
MAPIHVNLERAEFQTLSAAHDEYVVPLSSFRASRILLDVISP